MASAPLEHSMRRPPEHWKPAFRGPQRMVSEAGAALPIERIRAAAGVAA
jgi:hypothetical protein